MKNKILTLALGLFIGVSAFAENKTVNFSVNPPLVCNNCETKVKDNLRFEKGVKSVKPSAKKGLVEVTYDDDKTDIDNIKEGFAKIGYEAEVIVDGNCCVVEKTVCCESEGAACCVEEEVLESSSCCPSESVSP